MATNPRLPRDLIGAVIAAGVLLAAGWQIFEWTVNRVYVPVGKSLLLRYKGPLLLGSRAYPAPGQMAKVNQDGVLQIGMLEQLLGPGRHFYCPIWWERSLVEDQLVKPGQVAVVTSKVGADVVQSAESKDGQNPGDMQYLVEGGLGDTTTKGILRRVYGPGRYRVNPYAYEFRIIGMEKEQVGSQQKYAGWVSIPTGFVGVVTNQTANPTTKARKGIQQDVLPAGLYPINPREQQVDIIEIGYREKSINSDVKRDAAGEPVLDQSGEPLIVESDAGISFPSKDGFRIHMDFTAIWGVMPEQAARVVEYSGGLEAVENRVVVPLIESICRNQGSRLGAVELLVGETREEFQEEVTRKFEEQLRETGVSLRYGLVRHIYIPQDVRLPIQMAFLADELKLTRDQEQLTAKTEASLKEAERKVELEAARVTAETEKMAAEKQAEGAKQAAETGAETTKLVAEIAKKSAELEAQATVLLGTAEADAQRQLEEAKADKFKLAVAAFGSGDSYNQWVFASGLPKDIKLQLLYAGPGTFWTDLKGFTDVMLGKQVQDKAQPAPAERPNR